VKILVPIACALVLASCAHEVRGPAEPVTAVVGAIVVHPELDGAAAIDRDRTIIVSGGRIRSIEPSSAALPAGATVVAAKGKWVIPGLIDGHVHFFQSGNIYTRPDGADLNALVPYRQEVARNQARLPATFKVWIASGVTAPMQTMATSLPDSGAAYQ